MEAVVAVVAAEKKRERPEGMRTNPGPFCICNLHGSTCETVQPPNQNNIVLSKTWVCMATDLAGASPVSLQTRFLLSATGAEVNIT